MFVSEIVPLGPRILGFDMLEKLDDATARVFATLFAYGMRYVDLVEGTTALTLDPDELDVFARAQIPLVTCQFARTHGWSLAMGRNDGAAAARNHLALALPGDGSLTCDLEGKIASAQQAIDYGSAWFEASTSEGMDPQAVQLYVGEGIPLTGVQLENDLPFHGYCRSGSDVPDVFRRGYRMIQLRPLDQVVASRNVDLQVIQTDYEGGRPRWMRQGGPVAPLKG